MGFTALAVVGTSRIEVNNVLLEDLAEDDPFRQEFAFLSVNLPAFGRSNWPLLSRRMKIHSVWRFSKPCSASRHIWNRPTASVPS